MAQHGKHSSVLSFGGNNNNNTSNHHHSATASAAIDTKQVPPAGSQAPFQQSPVPTASQSSPGLRLPSNRKTIYDRHLNRSRNAETSRASFAFLFGEMVTYAQRRVTGIQDLERRYYPLKAARDMVNEILY